MPDRYFSNPILNQSHRWCIMAVSNFYEQKVWMGSLKFCKALVTSYVLPHHQSVLHLGHQGRISDTMHQCDTMFVQWLG